MAIVLSDNIQANAPKSIDSRYLNNLVPYTSVSAANAAILSGVRFTGLTVNILGTEYWYGTGVLDACLVTKSAGGTWGSITGVLSGQTDLQTCLNGKLASGGTAVCATTAGNALCLGGVLPAGYLLSGGTAKNSLCLGGNLANTYAPLASPNFTTCTCAPIVCATTCFVGSGAGLTGTAASLKSNDSSCLNGVLAAGYLLSGGTAVCATCAIGAKNLCGCVPSCFLGATATACCAVTAGNALCLGGQLPAYYMTATVGLTGATNGIGTTGQKACLGGALVAGTSITGNYALCLGTVASKLATLDLHSAGNTTIVAGALLMSSSGATYTDLTAVSKQGIKYASDYSATYDPRSLVDKGYVDSVATGLNIHASVVAATTTSITLSGNQTIDGVFKALCRGCPRRVELTREPSSVSCITSNNDCIRGL